MKVLAIETLITERCKARGLSRPDLVRCAGFKNVAKGLRRLDALCAGEMKATESLIAGLPAALELPPEVITDTIRETQQQLDEATRIAEEERDAAWRLAFRPCAYLLGTTDRPTCAIIIYGISGGAERWLKIPLDLSQPPVTFAQQAHAVVRRTSTVPFFGPTTGFIVNYTPECAVRFDLSGDPVETFDHAYRPGGDVVISIGGQRTTGQVFRRIIGIKAD